MAVWRACRWHGAASSSRPHALRAHGHTTSRAEHRPGKGEERGRPQRPGPGRSAANPLGEGVESRRRRRRQAEGGGDRLARAALAPPPARAAARAARRGCQSRASQPGSGGERSCYATAQRRPFAEKEAEPVPATASSEPPRAGGTGLSSRLAPTPTHLYPSVSVRVCPVNAG